MDRSEPEIDVGDLLRRARGGDSRARGTLVERWQPRILSRIRLMLGSEARRHAESLDFVQGVMVKVLARLDSEPFADEAHVLRWMTAVARNDIRDLAGKRRERAFESLSESWSSHAQADSRTPSPLSEAERTDHLLQLVECMERLSDDERTVVELHALEGLTFAAIGARLGWSDDRARLAHMRAMARLGQMIGDKNG